MRTTFAMEDDLAYALMVFGAGGAVVQTYELSAEHDRAAILQIDGIDLPHGAELRRGHMVIAKFGSWRTTHDHPEPGAMTRLRGILGARTGLHNAA